MQHKPILGIKHITKVRRRSTKCVYETSLTSYHHQIKVFRSARTSQGKVYPEMLFYVEDVLAQDLKPDPPPGWRPGQPLPQPAPIVPPPVVPLPSTSRTGLVPIAPQTSSAVAGPSTPRAQVRPADNENARQEVSPSISYIGPNARKEAIPSILYHVKHKGDNKNFIRMHIFHAPKRG
jgi:hypothetical protein